MGGRINVILSEMGVHVVSPHNFLHRGDLNCFMAVPRDPQLARQHELAHSRRDAEKPTGTVFPFQVNVINIVANFAAPRGRHALPIRPSRSFALSASVDLVSRYFWFLLTGERAQTLQVRSQAALERSMDICGTSAQHHLHHLLVVS